MTKSSKMLYEVGYGRPPKHTQWKKGESGNKSGARRQISTPQDMIMEELNRSQIFLIGGRKVKLTAGRLLIKALVKTAMGGNMKATLLLMDIMNDSQSAKQKSCTTSGKPRPSVEEISAMSNEETTRLYFEALKEANDEEERRRDLEKRRSKRFR